jgi:hypothetical protein
MMATSVERIELAPFGRVRLPEGGTFSYVFGNVPWVGLEEGSDVVPVAEGATVAVGKQALTLHNPFHYSAAVHVCRGAPVSFGPTAGGTLPRHLSETTTRSSIILPTGVQVGKRRGLGIIAKRGRYTVEVTGISNDANELIWFRKCNWQFAALRGAGVLEYNLPAIRRDGSLNDQLVVIGGYYTEAEITAWKAAAGYTLPETRLTTYHGGPDVVIDEQTAFFVTGPDSAAFRVTILANDQGDSILERR